MASDQQDTFSLAPFGSDAGPAVDVGDLLQQGAAGQLAAGLQLANSQTGPLIGMLQGQVADLASRLRDEQDRRRDLVDDHRNDLRDVEKEYQAQIREAEKRADKAERELEIAQLRAEFRGDAEQSTFDKLAGPLVESISGLVPALSGIGRQPEPIAVEAHTVPPTAPHPATSAPDGARDGAGTGAPLEDDVTLRARAVEAARQQFEKAIVAGVLAAVRGDGPPSEAAVGVLSGAVERFGLSPSPDQLARLAVAVMANASGEGLAAGRVAAALAPVVEGAQAAKALLASLTPEAAVPMLWAFARLDASELTPQREAYAADVLRALTDRALADPVEDSE